MDALWWQNEATEIRVCELDFIKWRQCYKTKFMVIGSWLAYIHQVMDALGLLQIKGEIKGWLRNFKGLQSWFLPTKMGMLHGCTVCVNATLCTCVVATITLRSSRKSCFENKNYWRCNSSCCLFSLLKSLSTCFRNLEVCRTLWLRYVKNEVLPL